MSHECETNPRIADARMADARMADARIVDARIADAREVRRSRRAWLLASGLGLGTIAAGQLLGEERSVEPVNATARSVIVLFMGGGPSHVDTFDPKP
ncbi:MAG: DUF1501 domain-containing protein, partial [Planctomycetota bacterium]